jgi:hypothetical protein
MLVGAAQRENAQRFTHGRSEQRKRARWDRGSRRRKLIHVRIPRLAFCGRLEHCDQCPESGAAIGKSTLAEHEKAG